jgi:hypothetical protein
VVEITFKNTGTTEGTWSVNIAFEAKNGHGLERRRS